MRPLSAPAGMIDRSREPRPRTALASRARRLLAALPLAALACSGSAAGERSLDELVLRDSTYLDPESLAPYTGAVYRTFRDDPARLQLEATMVEGTWHGELRVYHPNGRIRYVGMLVQGEQCGEWIQNRDPAPAGDIYEELVREIESLSLYPPCPEGP